jgi:hypothetical protein
MNIIKLIAITSLLTFTSCSNRSAKVANNPSPVRVEESNDQNWRHSDDAEFIGMMWVTLF